MSRNPGRSVCRPLQHEPADDRLSAARSRAHGPTAPLWHAVEVHRALAELDGACELTVCGSLARVMPEEQWSLVGRDICPACATLAR